MLLRLFERLHTVLLEHLQAGFVGDQLGAGEEAGAVNVVGVADGVDDIADALRTDALRKVDDLPRFGGERQRVDQDAAFSGDDQSSVHFQKEPAGEDPGIVGNAGSNDAHRSILLILGIFQEILSRLEGVVQVGVSDVRAILSQPFPPSQKDLHKRRRAPNKTARRLPSGGWLKKTPQNRVASGYEPA